jgi:hypothetical protein
MTYAVSFTLCVRGANGPGAQRVIAALFAHVQVCDGVQLERTRPLQRQDRLGWRPDVLTEWQIKAPEGVPCVLLGEARFKAVQRNRDRCQMGLPREGTKKPRPWQNSDVINNVLRSTQRHAMHARLELTTPITVHTFRKSFGQTHAGNGTPMHVLQHRYHADILIRVADASELDAGTQSGISALMIDRGEFMFYNDVRTSGD